MTAEWWRYSRNIWGQFTIRKQDLLPVHVYVKSDLNIHCMIIIIIMIITIVIISIIRRKTPAIVPILTKL